MATLKVYRTPIGFHDAYVAASSQKAALKAWGSDADLFARGVAEVVTDPALTAEPLAHPGEVTKRSRGTVAEQLAALPPDRPQTKASLKTAAGTKPKAKVKPLKPDRASVDVAEHALEEQQARQREEGRALAVEEAALDDRRRQMRAKHEKDREKLEAKLTSAEVAYAKALKAWREAN